MLGYVLAVQYPQLMKELEELVVLIERRTGVAVDKEHSHSRWKTNRKQCNEEIEPDEGVHH